MSGLKILRSRINSIKTTQKITKAMQLVSANKLKKIRTFIEYRENYLTQIQDVVNIMANDVVFLDSLSEKEKIFFIKENDAKTNERKPCLLVLITSERGLCGAFNSSIIRKVKNKIAELKNNNSSIKLIIVGKKGYDALKNDYAQYIDSYLNITSTNYEAIIYLLQQKIINLFTASKVGNCYLYFSEFENAMSYKLTELQIFPITSKQKKTQDNLDTNIYEYEGKQCLYNVINLYVGAELNCALTNNIASEEGARMTSMDSATKNANKITGELTLLLNRTRQAIITKELIEIISGAEAL